MGYSSSPNLVNIELVNLSKSGNLAPFTGENYYLTPNPAFIYIIRNIYYNVPAIPGGAGAGIHWLIIRTSGSAGAIADLSQWDNQAITINGLEFTATTEIPSSDEAQAFLCAGGWLKASYDAPLQFRYYNESAGNTQTNIRELYITYEKVKRTTI